MKAKTRLLMKVKAKQKRQVFYCLIPTDLGDKTLVRIAKSLMDLTGHRSETIFYGNEIEIYPRHTEEVVTITFPESIPSSARLTDVTHVFSTFRNNAKQQQEHNHVAA